MAAIEIKGKLNEIGMGNELPIVTKVSENETSTEQFPTFQVDHMIGEDIPLFLDYISGIVSTTRSYSQLMSDRLSAVQGAGQDIDSTWS